MSMRTNQFTRTIPAAVLDRVRTNLKVQANGCWISGYAIGSHGYAQIGCSDGGRTRTVTAHRASWEAANGPVPEGMTLDHTCHAKQCINPEHLRLLTNEQNGRRGGRDIDEVPEGSCLHGHGPEHMTRRERTIRGRLTTVPDCRVCRTERRAA